MKNSVIYLFMYFILVSTLSSSVCKADPLKETASRSISTEYFSVTLRNYFYDFENAGGGGAIEKDDDGLVYATAGGDFYHLNPSTLAVKKGFLPSLSLGRNEIGQSKFITYMELLPRVHDILYYGGNYFVSYDIYNKDEDRIRFAISRFDRAKKIWAQVFLAPPLDIHYYGLGNGGMMAGFKDNSILFSVGDYSMDRKNKLPSDFAAQNPQLFWGKINRLSLDTMKVEVFSMGLRNPQGLAIMKDGTIIAPDHGPRGGDKLVQIEKGKNYGWPTMSFGTNYNSYSLYSKDLFSPNSFAKNGFSDPIYTFVPSIAPTEVINVSDFHPAWNGNILLSSLKAASLFNIRLADCDGQPKPDCVKKVFYIEPIFVGLRIRDIKEVDKKIWILDDNGDLSSIEPNKDTPDPVGDKRVNLAPIQRCTVCHSVGGEAGTAMAPSLRHVFNRKIASTSFQQHSEAFKVLGKPRSSAVWDEASLKAFILHPNAFIPGTTMPDLHLNENEVDGIVQTLKTLQ